MNEFERVKKFLIKAPGLPSTIHKDKKDAETYETLQGRTKELKAL
jgi:hypothetical protein